MGQSMIRVIHLRMGFVPRGCACRLVESGRQSLERFLTRGSWCPRPKLERPGPESPGRVSHLLLGALGDLLLDIGSDALVRFVERGFAGDGLAEPADHRVEDHAVMHVALQLVGDRRQRSTRLR